MPTRFFLGAYWGSRTETVEECAYRLAPFLHRLAEADPLLSNWLKVGRNRAESRRTRIDPSPENLRQLLQESYDEQFPGLGFRFSTWDGRESSGVAMNVTCGSDAKVSPNVVVINPPLPVGENLRLYRSETVQIVFRAVVEEWDPDWAVFATDAMRDMQRDFTGHPFAGWLTYLRTDTTTMPTTETNVDIAPLGPVSEV